LAPFANSARHREVAVPPLPVRDITLTDRFFDGSLTNPTRAFVVGDRGKLTAEDGEVGERNDLVPFW
jgi:hypothetical protein